MERGGCPLLSGQKSAEMCVLSPTYLLNSRSKRPGRFWIGSQVIEISRFPLKLLSHNIHCGIEALSHFEICLAI